MVQKFVTNMRDKVKSMRKEEEGFSLVELIVVIVILAILIGVTIGGVYKYVNQSRVNTDVNNAATIQSTVSTLAVDKDVYKWASASAENDIVLKWSAAGAVDTASLWTNDTDLDSVTTGDQLMSGKVKALLTDGLPAAKSADHFTLTFDRDGNGNVVVTCKAYSSTDDTTVLVGQE